MLSQILCKVTYIFLYKKTNFSEIFIEKNIFEKCYCVLEKPISLQKFSKL